MKNVGELSFLGLLGGGALTIVDILFGSGELKYTVLALIFIATLLDWNSGRRAAKKDGINASQYGFEGIWRTGQIYLLLVFGHFIDKTFLLDKVEIFGSEPQGIVFYLFAFAILVDTMKSVTANHARIGWNKWIPDWALNWVASEIEHKIARAIKRRQEKEKYLGGDSK